MRIGHTVAHYDDEAGRGGSLLASLAQSEDVAMIIVLSLLWSKDFFLIWESLESDNLISWRNPPRSGGMNPLTSSELGSSYH